MAHTLSTTTALLGKAVGQSWRIRPAHARAHGAAAAACIRERMLRLQVAGATGSSSDRRNTGPRA